MRYLLTVVACLAFVGTASADPASYATAHVYVNVNPNIGVLPLEPSVDMGTVQTGGFMGHIPWRVDANTQYVAFWAAASGLYKGDDPFDPVVPPILLDVPAGIFIHIPDGSPIGAEDEYLPYSTGTDINGFPGLETIAVVYESSTPGHLSQDVDMTVWWLQPDPEKPMGEYSGMVRLSAMTVLVPY